MLQDVFKAGKPDIDTDDVVKKYTRNSRDADKHKVALEPGLLHVSENETKSRIGPEDDVRSESSISTITESRSALESCYTSTTTSVVTPNKRRNVQSRDWADYFGKSATPRSTSQSMSSVCDSFDNIDQKDLERYEADDSDEVYNYVRLNLENENLTDEDLRQQRLSQHLDSITKLSIPNTDLVETVTTSSGEKIVGSGKKKSKRKVAEEIKQSEEKGKIKQQHEKSSGPARWFKGRDKKSRVRLFTVEELVTTQEFTDPTFLHNYQTSRDQANHVPWEEAVLTVSL